ncbi:leucine-rich repeat-containing protein 43 isoform X1 [Astatotilapia calliptera]|uniref:leucine-rich repeat-containing protein 43 isoform X1 n=1 Tax=Astatotilapia calliptera TaxID=8154 RepID=UPI000329A1AD|nr:leucine-rich repeat-containing protein 43 isoform X1 [Maylandia zebra]XP_026043557.1 leucine-rich repeat-containing protein 43 isoform X1 [Astatotilapia calliptera]
MSSSTLSAVIEKLIRSLCLNDFPGGNGTWRNTKGSAERAEMESTDALLDLLSCPHSPWRHDAMWSPQALPLRQLAVLTPERLHAPFIYNYFTSLRIVDRDVTAIDDGLLKFSKLEELVLSANKISEVPTVHLPRTLKILELRANRLSSLDSLTSGAPPPHLQYLGLGSNTLGSHNDVTHLTGRQWPQLVCLDLSNCGFQDQPALLNGLSTLPCLRTLLLEGNPFTLASSYPGLTVDSLPQLSCLDTSWISPEERIRFRGLAKMSGLAVGIASPTVSVGRMMGIPDPRMTVDDKAPVFPVVSYHYFITYEFLRHQTPAHSKLDTETKSDTRSVTEGQRSNENGEKQTSKQDGGILNSEKPSCGNTCEVLRHSTSKLSWSESMDFGDTQTHTVSALGDLKKFLNRGLRLCLEEEKVLSWPAASEEVPLTKANQTGKEKKGRREKESPVKSDFTKSKDKNKKSVSELVQDAPIRRILGSVHIPLQSLVRGGQQVKVLCDFGMLHTDSEVEATQTHQKDLGRKIKDDKKEDKETKGRQHNAASSKDKEKKSLEVHDSITSQQEPVIVELIVELKKWQTASEAHHFLLPQTS